MASKGFPGGDASSPHRPPSKEDRPPMAIISTDVSYLDFFVQIYAYSTHERDKKGIDDHKMMPSSVNHGLRIEVICYLCC